MNPYAYKFYQNICKSVTSSVIYAQSVYQNSLLGKMIQLERYYVSNWAPRFSYLDQYSETYTPKRVQYGSNLSLALIATVLTTEVYL